MTNDLLYSDTTNNRSCSTNSRSMKRTIAVLFFSHSIVVLGEKDDKEKEEKKKIDKYIFGDVQ